MTETSDVPAADIDGVADEEEEEEVEEYTSKLVLPHSQNSAWVATLPPDRVKVEYIGSALTRSLEAFSKGHQQGTLHTHFLTEIPEAGGGWEVERSLSLRTT